MPTRIKPVHDLGPCVLDLASIRGICEHVCNSFNDVAFSAEDGVWEVYGEPKDSFLNIITEKDTASGKYKHETLDSFKIIALQHEPPTSTFLIVMEAEILFDSHQATVNFNGPQDRIDWFKHFVEDLKEKYLSRIKFRQRLLVERRYGNYAPLGLPDTVKTVGAFSALGGILANYVVDKISATRYCYIILYEGPPNALWQNIKANLLSNLIWIVIVFVAGILFALFALWLWNRYSININDFPIVPSVPTSTPEG